MKNFLPSRTVIALVLVPAVTLIAIMGVTAWNNREVVGEEGKVNVLARALEEGNEKFRELDTDNDGLRDWEEFLYQTDETNPDTDGDGASDGSEVARGYDPLVSGTGTTTEVTSSTTAGLYFYKEDSTLTRTDVLSRDTFTKYLELRKSGGLNQDNLVQKALNDAIRENTNVESTIRYELSDITVVPESSFNARQYRSSYNKAAELVGGVRYDEIELLAQYLYSNDVAAYNQITLNKDIYENFVKELEKMRVPKDVAPVHVELMNNTMIAVDSLEGMTQVEEDPLKALVFSQKFEEDRNIVLKNTQAIKLYFDTNGL